MTSNTQMPTLQDKYDPAHRTVFVGGMQAVVRLLIEQSERDQSVGLNTGGFVSGYRGSPIGRLDSELWSAAGQLDPRGIVFRSGVNEELAATSVWGAQQVQLLGPAKVEGVFGLWYGKGPGVDRSGDAFKHANLAGVSANGGVLVLAGDDPAGKSSTTAHQSEQALIAASIPVLVPADLQEVLDFGILGYAMSRHSGCWIGLKVTTAVADASASIETTLGRLEIARSAPPSESPHARWPDDLLAMERRLAGPRLAAVREFARVNPVDRLVWETPDARMGIVTSGRSHYDVIDALRQRGIDEAAAKALGIRVYKVGLSWPIEPKRALAFADGLDRILVVEEKRGLIEPQLKELLYDNAASDRPVVFGKTAPDGVDLVPAWGELSPANVKPALDLLLAGLAPASLPSVAAPPPTLPPTLTRNAFFCAGCPHNRSTKVPDGSIALAGIGCHTMASRMPERKTVTICQMGGEGAAWIGQAPFSTRGHVFQNLGDGTYFHSGFLAIRAAVAAGVNITYKLLLNDAVAMTGGQPVDGTLSVESIAAELVAEGVKRLVVVTDTPEEERALPHGVAVRPRQEMDAVQRELREVAGVTVLIYQQVCAAEKRRRRKRKLMPEPDRRLFVNERVCEGCGDCVRQSSCIAVAPVETPFGRKRRIDQSACNKDFSCLEGFCPSFVAVEGGRLRRTDSGAVKRWLADAPPLSEPVGSSAQRYRVLITGIGGTGVVTVGAVLAMAAHLDGARAQTLDQTGLAQKNGAVSSHVTIARSGAPLGAVTIGAAETDLLIACDAVVAAASGMIVLYDKGRTKAVVNGDIAPTAGQTFGPAAPGEHDMVLSALDAALGGESVALCNAGDLSRALLGDTVFANMMMLGFAWQGAGIPVSIEAIRSAIRLNGAAVENNLAAFEIGRHLASRGEDALSALRPSAGRIPTDALEAIVVRQRANLEAYQDEAYAQRYAGWVNRFVEAEARLGIGGDAVSLTVATTLPRLMAYKDEYEVARLYSDGEFRENLERQFEPGSRLTLYLAPPLLSRTDPATGRPRKRAFGPWVFPAMRALAGMKRLRGTMLDPFGCTRERKAERRLVADYEVLMEDVLASLGPDRVGEAVALLSAASEVRGYGPVKEANLAAYHEWLAAELPRWRADGPVAERVREPA